MHLLRYIAFSKIILNFSFTNFFLFSTLKNKPSRSRRSASGVKEKCVRGQPEVRRGSRRSAPGVKEKCVRGQGDVLQLNTPHLAKALLLDARCTSPWPLLHFSFTPDALILDPWRTFPWPLTHFFLTWKAYFSELEKAKKSVYKKFKIIFENAINLKLIIHFSG